MAFKFSSYSHFGREWMFALFHQEGKAIRHQILMTHGNGGPSPRVSEGRRAPRRGGGSLSVPSVDKGEHRPGRVSPSAQVYARRPRFTHGSAVILVLSTTVSVPPDGLQNPPWPRNVDLFVHRLEPQSQVSNGTQAEVVNLGHTSDRVVLRQTSRAWVLREAASRPGCEAGSRGGRGPSRPPAPPRPR